MTAFFPAVIMVYEKETSMLNWFLYASFLLNILIGIAVLGICVVFAVAHIRFRRYDKKTKDE